MPPTEPPRPIEIIQHRSSTPLAELGVPLPSRILAVESGALVEDLVAAGRSADLPSAHDLPHTGLSLVIEESPHGVLLLIAAAPLTSLAITNALKLSASLYRHRADRGDREAIRALPLYEGLAEQFSAAVRSGDQEPSSGGVT